MKTVRTDIDCEVRGVNLFAYNPIYPDTDIISLNANTKLPFFKYPYLNNAASLADKIEVVSQFTTTKTSEY